jgi:hypothetical protein
MVVGDGEIDDDEKCRQIAGNFHCLGNAAVRRYDHQLMEHIEGYTESHWMPQSGECLRCIIAQRPPWSSKLVEKTKTLTKHKF